MSPISEKQLSWSVVLAIVLLAAIVLGFAWGFRHLGPTFNRWF